jgi:hypothetical protein
MWVFLATEVLFFGGMFLAYTLYRQAYPEIFHQGAKLMEFWPGTINTALLLTSSLFMAIADRAVLADRKRLAGTCLGLTWFWGRRFWESRPSSTPPSFTPAWSRAGRSAPRRAPDRDSRSSSFFISP